MLALQAFHMLEIRLTSDGQSSGLQVAMKLPEKLGKASCPGRSKAGGIKRAGEFLRGGFVASQHLPSMVEMKISHYSELQSYLD